MKKYILPVSFLYFCIILQVSGNESCTAITDLGEVCAYFQQQDNCQVEVQATLNGTIILFAKTLTLQELALPNTTFCATVEDCHLCYDWDVFLNNQGSATGCVSLFGSCVSQETQLGCFEDDALATCASSCPNDCSGHGQCQYSGTCNCAQGFYSEDCSLSTNCEDRTETINRMYDSHAVEYYIEKGNSWIGYITGYQPLAQISVSISAAQGSLVDIWSLKSCYPIPDQMYDYTLNDVGQDEQTLLINSDCSDINGGVWYVLVQCSANSPSDQCSFTINTFKEKILALTPGLPHIDSIWKLDAFYTFIVDSSFPALTIDVTTYANLDFVAVDILPGYCPTNQFAFARISVPTYFVNDEHGQPAAAKYILNLASPQHTTWFVRIIPEVNNEFHVIGSEVELHYAIVASAGTCPECQHGYCSSDNTCTCESFWTGLRCDQALPHETPQYSDSGEVAPANSSYLVPIIGGVIGISVLLVVVLVAVILIARKIKKAKSPPADTLYNMLTNEQDIDAM